MGNGTTGERVRGGYGEGKQDQREDRRRLEGSYDHRRLGKCIV